MTGRKGRGGGGRGEEEDLYAVVVVVPRDHNKIGMKDCMKKGRTEGKYNKERREVWKEIVKEGRRIECKKEGRKEIRKAG